MDSFYMKASVGITEPNFTQDPLGTEGEMSVGPDSINPFRSAEEAEIIEQIKQKEREKAQQEDAIVRTTPVNADFLPTFESPTEGDDPFIFDDVSDEVDDVSLPFMDSSAPKFPDF
jgi:hypothetical protein